MTTREDIAIWFDAGRDLGATHMIVVVDDFDYEDFPVYVESAADFWDEYARRDGPNMQRVMEVYDLAADREQQLSEQRAFHPPAGGGS